MADYPSLQSGSKTVLKNQSRVKKMKGTLVKVNVPLKSD